MTKSNGALLWQFVENWASVKPDAEALVFGDHRMSWAEYRDEVDAVAKGMMAAGVQRGDRVAMLDMARNEFMVTFMAASKIGATWLGLSPKFTMAELDYILQDSTPCVVFSTRRFGDRDLAGDVIPFMRGKEFIKAVVTYGDAPEGCMSYEAFRDAGNAVEDAALAERAALVHHEDDVLLLYTSGSTGKPKGVVHCHRAILKNIEVQCERLLIDPDARVLLHFPINHVAATVEIGFGSTWGGATTIMMDAFDPVASLEVIEQERITMLGQVPVMYLLQMQTPKFREMDWRHVRIFVWSGASAPAPLLGFLHQICQATGARLLTGYGSTELCGFCTYSNPDDSLELLAKTAGKMAPGFEGRLLKEDGSEADIDEVGELHVRGPILLKRYLNKPEATAEVLSEDGWFKTGDLMTRDAAGNYFVTGRASEMFKTGGENVFPREVEETIEAHPAVVFAAVIGVPDDLYQEVGHAFVMKAPGAEVEAEELRAWCRDRLVNFKVPKFFEVRKELPLLPTGKVSKMALRKELEGRG